MVSSRKNERALWGRAGKITRRTWREGGGTKLMNLEQTYFLNVP